MNDLDKKDLLELAQIIKIHAQAIDSLSLGYEEVIDGIEEIIGCADTIIEIVENKPHKIERMF